MAHKHARTASLIKNLAAEFFGREAFKDPLITVTDASVSDDLRTVKIFISVFPESGNEKALGFAERKRGLLADYFKSHSKLGRIPFIQVEIDAGEENRRRIEELLTQ